MVALFITLTKVPIRMTQQNNVSMKKEVAKAAVVLAFAVSAMALTIAHFNGGVSTASPIKISKGHIVYKDKAYCNDDGYCAPSSDLTLMQLKKRMAYQIPEDYYNYSVDSNAAKADGFGDDMVVFSSIEVAQIEGGKLLSPFQTAPLYKSTIDRVNDYLDQGFALRAGYTAEKTAKKVDVLANDISSAVATGNYIGAEAKNLEEREHNLLKVFSFDGAVEKRIDNFAQLVGVKNPEIFVKPSIPSKKIVTEMKAKGYELKAGITDDGLARELDVAVSEEAQTVERLAVINGRFISSVENDVQKLFDDAEKEVSAQREALEEFSAMGKGMKEQTEREAKQKELEKFGGKYTKDDATRDAAGELMSQLVQKYPAQMAAAAVIFIASTTDLNPTSSAADKAVTAEDLAAGAEILKKQSAAGKAKAQKDALDEMAAMAEAIRQQSAKDADARASEDRASASIQRARRIGNAEMGDSAAPEQPANAPDKQPSAPAKTYVKTTSQGTAKDNTAEGVADNVAKALGLPEATSPSPLIKEEPKTKAKVKVKVKVKPKTKKVTPPPKVETPRESGGGARGGARGGASGGGGSEGGGTGGGSGDGGASEGYDTDPTLDMGYVMPESTFMIARVSRYHMLSNG